MPFRQGDFVEIEFTGRTKDGNVFDSNISEELKKLNPEAEAKPFVFPLGHGMFLKGIEEFLLDREQGMYEISLPPEKAFGKRDSKKIKIIPINVFREKNVNPVPGVAFNFDGLVGKIITVSGGRVIVDFNNLLAGKEVIYKIKVNRKIDDINEKVKAMLDFLFRREFDFQVEGRKLVIFCEKEMKDFIGLFTDKFREILELDLEVREKEEDVKEPEKAKEEEAEK